MDAYAMLSPGQTLPDSGDGPAIELPRTAFRARTGGLGRAETEALVEDACTAGNCARVVGPEGNHLNAARTLHEPTCRVRQQRTADALPAFLLRDDEPVDLVDRGLATKQQATEDIRSRGDSDERRGPANVLVHGAMETGTLNHWAEPVLDLGCQANNTREVLLSRESDDHPRSLADEANVA